MQESVWIGLVGVFDESKEKILRGATGAYVNVLALATNAKDYSQQVRTALQSVGLKAFEFGEVEPFCDREAQFKVPRRLKRIAGEVARTGTVTCDEFFVFKESGRRIRRSFRTK